MRRPDLDDWMARFVAAGRPGAAVAVRLRGSTIHAAGYGLANLEWEIPIDLDTVFRLGSITKQFTAAAIVRLAEAGKLDFDDPVARHLPRYPPNGRRITVRHLLNHSSGVANYTDDARFMADEVRNDHTTDQLVDIIMELPADFEPGERHLYSNSGYVLLGAIIEACSGTTYEAFLRTEFFAPLGLTRTCYLYDAPIIARRASGYQGLGAPRNAPMLSMHNPHGAGGLGSTVSDLLRWEAALRGGEVVSPAGYRAMTSPELRGDGAESYGFGLIHSMLRGDTVISHGGRINGFVTHLAHWPDHDLTVVVLANSGDFQVSQALFGLARRMLGQPDAAYERMALPQGDLAACAGVYRFPNTEELPLRVEGDALVSSFPHPGSLYLPFAADRFFLADDPEITFRFEDGARERVTLHDYRNPMVGRRVSAAD